MKKDLFCFSLALLLVITAMGQDTIVLEADTPAVIPTPVVPAPVFPVPPKPAHVYTLHPAVDVPIVAVGTAWSIFAFTKIYSKDPSTPEQIMSLDENDIPKIDRWAAGMSDEKADKNADYLFYGSLPLPFLLLFDKEIREDAPRIAFLYWEAMAVTGLFYTGGVYFFDRYRPETYNTDIPVSDRLSGNFKDAFPAGHPALVATATFFTAKVYADYHPGSTLNYVFFGLAAGATGATAYLRHIAGKHFPTDLFAGVTWGTLSGILVPQLHKKRKHVPDVGFIPFTNGKDVAFSLRIRIH